MNEPEREILDRARNPYERNNQRSRLVKSLNRTAQSVIATAAPIVHLAHVVCWITAVTASGAPKTITTRGTRVGRTGLVVS